MDNIEYRRLRIILGTQPQAAEILGVSRSTIARREAQKGEIKPEPAAAILAAVKGRENAELRGGSGSGQPESQPDPES